MSKQKKIFVSFGFKKLHHPKEYQASKSFIFKEQVL